MKELRLYESQFCEVILFCKTHLKFKPNQKIKNKIFIIKNNVFGGKYNNFREKKTRFKYIFDTYFLITSLTFSLVRYSLYNLLSLILSNLYNTTPVLKP